MENNSGPEGSHRAGTPATSAEARAALDGLEADAVRLAERVVTPWWYHPALGLIVTMLVAAQALSQPLSLTLIVLGILAIVLLASSYRRKYGISTTEPAGPRSRRLMLLQAGILAVGMIAALLVKFAGAPSWWLLPAAGVAGLSIIVIGRRYDEVLRQELARGADGAE